MTILAHTTEIHESLQHLFTETAGNFDVRSHGKAALLRVGDPLWIEQDVVRVQPEDARDVYFVIRVFDLRTGRQYLAIEAKSEFFRDQMRGFDWDWFGRNCPNSYVTNGEHLFVSGGEWTRVAEGVDEFTSRSARKAAQDARASALRDEWLTANADQVVATQPAWADGELTHVEIKVGDETVDYVEYACVVGAITIEQLAFLVDGKLSLADSPTLDGDHMTASEAREYGRDLIRAAEMLES